MNQKSGVVLALAACFLVAVYCDQGVLDCRKLVFSRNCRGVANKRAGSENDESQRAILRDGSSLKRIAYDIGPPSGSAAADAPSPRKGGEKGEDALRRGKLQLEQMLFKLFLANNRRANENDYAPLYEY